MLGTISKPYVQVGNHNALFEIELASGEKEELNTNNVKEIRAKEKGIETYHQIKSRLEMQGYKRFEGAGLIPSGSKLAILEGDMWNHRFNVLYSRMPEDRIFRAGCPVNFSLKIRDKEEEFDIGNLDNLLYVKTRV
ncbi:hypothetical protein HOA92_04405 [archaeon]|jgi:hypothetical protein|nr:hypothetical protein [archaeon]